ncbi:MAG: hypothetical protein GY702_01095 [Desulfobulbaceae bacterium]|nr:hypothetical protein [Desulfobulbaceae bacterium]
MKLKIAIYLIVFFFCGAAIGLWLGQKTSADDFLQVGCRPAVQGELDHFYTDVLKITDTQKSKISAIEKTYQSNRAQFTERMHRANMLLADIIEDKGYDSNKIGPVVAEIHLAMGELQTLSLSHLAAIENVLKPEQAALLKSNAVARLRQN